MSAQTVDVIVFTPGTSELIRHQITIPQEPHYGDLNKAIGPLIGGGIKNIEHVTVLFDGVRADMFVDDESASKGLEVNQAATRVYHEASRRRGDDMTAAPRIYGVAVLSKKILWT